MKDKIMNFPLIRFIINLRICQWAANNPVLLSDDWSVPVLKKELIPFISCRIFSFFVDTAFMEITVSLLCWNEPAMKLLSNVFVLLINYIGSKLLVFKKRS